MPARSRILSKDEELGKRDDDFRPAPTQQSTMSSLLPWYWRKRRVVLAILLAGLIYVFTQNLPKSITVATNDQSLRAPLDVDDGNSGRRIPTYPTPPKLASSPRPKAKSNTVKESTERDGAPARERSVEDDERAQHYFDGPIKFWRLGESLQNIAMTMGARPDNRNVLFAASSLKSFANLMPMACEMAKQNRAYPHFVLFGRSTVAMDDLLEINGVSKEICSVYLHDARADFAMFSSDERAYTATAGAMVHVQTYMHPQAVIMDDQSVEDTFFVDAMKRRSKDIQKPLIVIPRGRYEDFMWITRLDATSLLNWYTPTIDIVIKTQPESTGSLIRLLKSLRAADYGAIRTPRLTIELPATSEASVVSQLARIQWPPDHADSPDKPSALTIRHHIPSMKITPEQASLRFLESFYPNDPGNHHILILSPQAEVSPLYMQYLVFSILKYRYASFGAPGSEDVLGFALDAPSSKLDGSVFRAPSMANMTSWKNQEHTSADPTAPVPFVFQAPASGAALIFGDKWATLHNFVANRLRASHLGKAAKLKKIVSEAEPAWMEYLLELMRARGWGLLHPSLSLVTLHNELAKVPEEFLRTPEDSTESAKAGPQPPSHHEDESFLTATGPPVILKHVESDTSSGIGPLHRILPFNGDLPDVYDVPYYSHDGVLLSYLDASTRVDEYKTSFRGTVGGCTSQEAQHYRSPDWLNTDDLFCLPGMPAEAPDGDMEFEEDEGEDEAGEGDDAEKAALAIAALNPKDMDEAAAETAAAAAAAAAAASADETETIARRTIEQAGDGTAVELAHRTVATTTDTVASEVRDEIEVGSIVGAS